MANKQGRLLLVSLVLVCCTARCAVTYTLTAAAQLEDDLLNGYKKTLRPAPLTEVSISFGLMHINSLDIVTQQIDLVGFIVMSWTDSRFVFNSTDYDNMTFTTLHQNNVWLPPLVLNNGANGIKIITDDSDFASNYIGVLNTGIVYLVPAANFVSQCSVNIKYYPFESQSCKLIMTPWGFGDDQLKLYSSQLAVILDLFVENGEWDITSTLVANMSRNVGGSHLSAVEITINMERKYSYYLINLILPIIFLALLGCCVFLLPVQSGEKNGFSLTILLSMSVMMTLLSDHIPPIATQTCLLSVYLLTIFIVCMLETGATVFACQLHQYTEAGYTPGARLQALARFLARLSLYRRPNEQEKRSESSPSSHHDKPGGLTKVRPLSANAKGEWSDKMDAESKPDNVEDYTYEDISFMYDRINFVFFVVVTSILSVGYFIGLSVGGSAQ